MHSLELCSLFKIVCSGEQELLSYGFNKNWEENDVFWK